MVWTSGIWTVKPGHEDEFIGSWAEFAQWSRSNFPAGRAWLLRRRDQPNVFVSVGPWPSDEVIESWRGSDGFRKRIGHIRELLLSFEPQTLDQAVEVT